MKTKKILIICAVIFSFLLITSMASAYSIYPRPKDKDGELMPDRRFTYEFNFIEGNECQSNVLLNETQKLRTDESGVAYIDINLSSLDKVPDRLCIYRSGMLEVNKSFDSVIFNDVYAQTGNFSESISSAEIFQNGNEVVDNTTTLWQDTNDVLSPRNLSKNVGIGTDNPTSKFAVQGESNFNGETNLNDVSFINDNMTVNAPSTFNDEVTVFGNIDSFGGIDFNFGSIENADWSNAQDLGFSGNVLWQNAADLDGSGNVMHSLSDTLDDGNSANQDIDMNGNNIQLNDGWLSNDGDNEGIRIFDDGHIGIGTGTRVNPLFGSRSVTIGGDTVIPIDMNEESGSYGIQDTNDNANYFFFGSGIYNDTKEGTVMNGYFNMGTDNHAGRFDMRFAGDERFYFYEDGTMLQSGSGNVGIGYTPSNLPTEKLDVDGNINIPENNAYRIGGSDVLRINSGTDGLAVGDTASDLSQQSMTAVGRLSGQNAGNHVASLGHNAARGADTFANALGAEAGRDAGREFAAVGSSAGQASGNSFSALGHWAGREANNEFVALGSYSGYRAGNRFISIGHRSTRTDALSTPDNIQDSIALGYESAPQYDGHFVLQQANLGDGSPIIQGDLETDQVGINLSNGATLAEALNLGGNLEMNDNGIQNVTTLRFNTSEKTPTHQTGQLYYNGDDTLNLDTGKEGVTAQITEEMFIKAKNDEGSTIENGQLVYQTGYNANSGIPEIQLAQANSKSEAKVMGMATHDISNNERGVITTYGKVRDIDTSGFSVGDSIWLSPTNPGEYTTTEPLEPNYSVEIGTISKQGANDGEIQLNLGDRTIGDLLEGRIPFSDGDEFRQSSGFTFNSSTQNLTVGGNITAENVFTPQYVSVRTNKTVSLPGASQWKNITYDQVQSEVEKGIDHDENSNTNQTFTINKDGRYRINYHHDVQDNSTSASDIHIGARVTQNGNEIPGSMFEIGVDNQAQQQTISNSFITNLNASDEITFQFIADDPDVIMSSSSTFGENPVASSINIERVDRANS